MAERGIITKILSTARERGEALLRQAEARRDAELKEAMAELESASLQRLEAARKGARETAEQELSSFRLVERNRTQALKRRLLDAVYEKAWEKALEPRILRRWVEARLREFCREGDTLIVPASQAGLFAGELRELLSKLGLTLSAERGAFRAGFIVEQGSIRLNCTLDQEMKEAIRESEIDVARILFG